MKQAKKLQLDVTKLRELTASDQAGVAGGTSLSTIGPCQVTCTLSGEP